MSKLAFIFPGQGSQYVGMGKELASEYEKVQALFTEADEILDFGLTKLAFEGPERDLRQTSNTQPALLTTSMACYEVLVSQGIKPDYLAGHSLGEYSALVAAQSLPFAQAVKLVRQRGLLMEEAYPSGQGGMAAVLGLATEVVEEICSQARALGIVQVANYNCPGQIVISGENKALELAMDLAKKAGAKRVVPLEVSGPFHSVLMEEAGKKLAAVLDEVEIAPPQIPVIANVNAQPVTRQEEVKPALVKQISHSVRWEETLNKLYDLGVRTFVEVGPGKVLCGLVKRTLKDVLITNVQDIESLEKTLNLLKGA